MSDIELISPESVNADPSPVKSKTKIDEEEQWNNYIDVYNQLQKLKLKQFLDSI